MTRLIVFYDARCGLCCAVAAWLRRQRQLMPLECRRCRPDMQELVIVADSGEMWSGDDAWLMALWALADYRDWSYRLASPLLIATAKALFATLSEYRGSLSCTLGLAPP